MASKARLQELYKKGKQSGFTLPKDITVKKSLSGEGYGIQTFYHLKLGQIGRIIIIPYGLQTQICCEVMGDPDDPITQTKREIFTPIANEITNAMNNILGGGVKNIAPYSIKEGGDVVESQVFPCNICQEIVGMVISAHDAQTQGDLEDYASKMYVKVKELNVPTWVIGREREIILNDGSKTGEALSMKIWPQRE
jgi:hypothetical protein